VALFIVTLVQVALLNKATYGQFTLRLQDLDERQRAARDLGYRYSYRILASAVTVLLAVALQLPADRLLGATNRLAWLAVAIVVVKFMWMLPTMIVGGMEPDPPRRG
jgi:lauroyl/myristoyl acyltransferase